MKNFHNKVVYITGGSSGIGLETARLFAKKGAHLVFLARDFEKLEKARKIVEQERRNNHQKVSIISVDVSDFDDVGQKTQQALDQAGAPDILINGAGVIATDYFENITYETFDQLIKINVYGVWNVTTALLPAMKIRGGQIVIVASAAGLMGVFGYTAYGTSKFALVGFSECLRSELKPMGIDVSLVCPTEVKTPMMEVEARTIPSETIAVKRMAGSLMPEYTAKVIVKGIAKKKFMIIPGHMARWLYLFQRYAGGTISRFITDLVVRISGPKKMR